MKAVPYSPFSKTYKYVCLQNQLAHTKNKKNVKGLVDSNLNLDKDLANLSKTFNLSEKGNQSYTTYQSFQDLPQGTLKKQPLIIHRDSRYESRKKLEITK